jgi:probable F420-dependent oxidoreductase
MDYGIAIFLTDETIGPAHLARLVEERGFSSLWVPEHTHIPTSRSTEWRPGKGQELPRHYWRCLDPFVALTAAAAATTTLRVGTGICLLIQRDPIVTAKEVATLDVLSDGRFEFGVGAGWNQDEIENHGTPFDRRFRVLRERVEAITAIWEQDEASYHGEFVDFTSITSWPKPVQKPHPPIYVGGHGPKVFDRVLRYAGRDHIPVRYFGADRDRGALERLTEAGVDEIQFYLEPLAPDEAERQLDEVAELVASTRA